MYNFSLTARSYLKYSHFNALLQLQSIHKVPHEKIGNKYLYVCSERDYMETSSEADFMYFLLKLHTDETASGPQNSSSVLILHLQLQLRSAAICSRSRIIDFTAP
jgi:hypothetical protein